MSTDTTTADLMDAWAALYRETLIAIRISDGDDEDMEWQLTRLSNALADMDKALADAGVLKA